MHSITGKADLLAKADLCVKCGLCLPHCPTYGKTQNENESPRGRIALIQAWADDNLPTSKQLTEHIDHCLLCRSCERVCPANVPYGQLVDSFRDQVGITKSPLAISLLKVVVHSDLAKQLAYSLLGIYSGSRLQKAARKTGLSRLLKVAEIDRLLSAYSFRPALEKNFYPAATGEVRGEVGLFHGCMGKLLDNETVTATISILNLTGFNVHIPQEQSCCGALDLHSGDKQNAQQLAELNGRAFGAQPLDNIVSIASGCGATLQEYENAKFAEKIIDINYFLHQSGSLDNLSLSPLNAKVMLHTPCSLKNIMRAEQSPGQLLTHIPGIEIINLPETIQCCGSAGSYMLQYPDMAKALLDDLLQRVETEQPQYLLSTNIGCVLHIAAGLEDRGLKVEVLHPLVLIMRLLSD